MSKLFTMLPFSVNDPTLPVIPSGDIRRLFEAEINAAEHWIFDNGEASLVGKINGLSLTPQSTAPTYSADYLTIASDVGKALLTTFEETAGQEDTIAAVFKYSAHASKEIVPFGSISSTVESPPLTGGAPYIVGVEHTVSLTYRGSPVTGTNTTVAISPSTWVFLCVSRKMTASGVVRALIGGSAIKSYTGDYSSYVPATAGRKIGLGSPYFVSLAGQTVSFAEAVVFDRALDSTEISQLYDRSKARMTKRGITIL